jgi:Protein of unknown function (DUF3048) N-terminal domain/Protein of unknown function (DUF3048) C-terminal domain
MCGTAGSSVGFGAVNIAKLPPRRGALLALLLATALAGQACGCSGPAEAPVRLATPPSPTPTPKPAVPKPKPKPKPVHPLTGIGGPPKGPVIAVKIDNVAEARPQYGLTSADVVYVEMAEGGLTRLVAIYSNRRPRTVAPVRSVRNSDPELLGQYGPIGLAFSGGASGVVANFRRSNLVDGSADARGGAYRRQSNRSAPHNLAVDLYVLSRAIPRAAGVRDVGFDWAATDPRLAKARRVNGFSVLMGSTSVRYQFSRTQHAFLQRGPGGSPQRDAGGHLLATPNVLVLFCPVTVDGGDVDAAGNPAKYTHTVGRGNLLLFRDGRVVPGSWRRTRAGAPTQYLDRLGKPLLLRPGGAWVLLAPYGSPVSY